VWLPTADAADEVADWNNAIFGAFTPFKGAKRAHPQWSPQMNRRFLLASIATLPAGRVIAQSTSQPAPAPSASTDARQKHIRDTTAYGSLSLLLSRMAKSKVTHPMLKQFVDFEIRRRHLEGAPDER
jgi:hypothetical protein